VAEDIVLDENGNLLPGLHDATIEQIAATFGSHTERRRRLMSNLQRYMQQVQSTGWSNTHVILDGSFVMAGVEQPDDIDLILVFPEGWDSFSEMRPFEYNLLWKSMVRRGYEIEVFSVRFNSSDYHYWVEFFGRVNLKWCQQFGLPENARKGIVRVVS
jgi:hypothetical protein